MAAVSARAGKGSGKVVMAGRVKVSGADVAGLAAH
ncbi:Uncharacterised protein [Mycolicibacterium gilvum]|uniref:Uncharacterized protein n=1 Tax=Mycolicibacterium gilvum TaxID=1804 RepID=A0A378SRD2_9MYCO|nr:Uncharacterised protein [Mycolicibacterium gilvum]